jgi:hypothetical protein
MRAKSTTLQRLGRDSLRMSASKGTARRNQARIRANTHGHMRTLTWVIDVLFGFHRRHNVCVFVFALNGSNGFGQKDFSVRVSRRRCVLLSRKEDCALSSLGRTATFNNLCGMTTA